ncbi:DUF3783 domain-containing protein [Olsenella profusa]|uniref:DUF3783 domain-containing protein n=1 Tax=Olsenella profusa TaxID=138595 RepID=A0ABS2F1P8_9ACTN|nr:DUF3783 domain-containing protein [Olsenella profusa]MBM6774745.1 DUF3783 domain-containing protein [Olsenella profusa]
MAGKPKKKAAHAKKVKPSGPVPCAVLWGLDPSGEKGAAVRAVLREMGVVARTATYERLGDPAGAFARLVGFRPTPVPYAGPEPPCAEFVLLCGLTSVQVDEFLARSREAGCVVGHKAMLTKLNRAWPLVRLMSAVAAEHDANT